VSSRTPVGVRPPPRRPDRAPAVRHGIGYVPALDGVRALAVLAFHGGMPWAGGVQVRSDGLHLTPSGVQQWIAPWLLPRLRDAVTR
jgi:hypothetical protein